MEDEINYRWYWFSKKKSDEIPGWHGTCYARKTIDDANELANSEFYLADKGSREHKLVKETMSYSDI